MRLTGMFAVSGLLVAALAALPLARLWALSQAFGDPASARLAVSLAIGGAVLLAGLMALLYWQLLRPLKIVARALRGPADAASGAPVVSTALRDLAALAQAAPRLRERDAAAQALEAEVAQAQARAGEQDAALHARMRYLKALIDSIPLPIAIRDAEGRELLANRGRNESR